MIRILSSVLGWNYCHLLYCCHISFYLRICFKVTLPSVLAFRLDLWNLFYKFGTFSSVLSLELIRIFSRQNFSICFPNNFSKIHNHLNKLKCYQKVAFVFYTNKRMRSNKKESPTVKCQMWRVNKISNNLGHSSYNSRREFEENIPQFMLSLPSIQRRFPLKCRPFNRPWGAAGLRIWWAPHDFFGQGWVG